MIVIIDNYDSFTYNLYQYIGEFTKKIEVYRNDQITIDQVFRKKPSHIVISPGPGLPKDAGISETLVKETQGQIPVLGICLGHQAIGEVYGGKIIHARVPVHGKASEIDIDTKCTLFQNLNGKIKAGRYHSLIVENNSLPDDLKITALSAEGEIMGLQHKQYPVYGVQFHPESLLTPDGKEIIKNFLSIG